MRDPNARNCLGASTHLGRNRPGAFSSEVDIGSLSDAIGETSKAATSVLTASSELTSTAQTLSRELDSFFHNLRADPLARHDDGARRSGTG